MGWLNFAYLVLGLGLGLAGSWLFCRTKEPLASDHGSDVDILNSQTAPQNFSLKEELKQTQLAYQMATEMSQFKAGFLARTAHELRSPLSSLMSLHQLILSGLCEDRDEEREFLAQAHASAFKLVKLIDEIVAVAKTEHGTNELEIQPLRLAGVLDEVYKLTYLQAANRSLRFHVSRPNPEIYILADPRWLRQVLVNLVDTAIAKMDEGSIYVSAHSSPTSGYVHILIDAECPESAWSDPIDLLLSTRRITNEQPNKTANVSRGLNLLIDQILIELMQGRLEVIDVAHPRQPQGIAATARPTFTRLQCSIPLLLPEAASSEQLRKRSLADCVAPSSW
ncbi:MAG TPA: HAMP domain-containing sensor histidine kinase [Candidatus Obscuribacterales bacterium]